jgi:hypothetical protein
MLLSHVVFASVLGFAGVAIAAQMKYSISRTIRTFKVPLFIMAAIWYVLVTRAIVQNGIGWPVNLGYEVAGGNSYESMNVPTADATYVVAWYALTVAAVLLLKRKRNESRA